MKYWCERTYEIRQTLAIESIENLSALAFVIENSRSRILCQFASSREPARALMLPVGDDPPPEVMISKPRYFARFLAKRLQFCLQNYVRTLPIRFFKTGKAFRLFLKQLVS